MSEASFNAYESSYKKLDTKEGEKNIYKLARTREKKSRDLGNVRCNKSEDNRVLIIENDIKESWKNYFHKLYNWKLS